MPEANQQVKTGPAQEAAKHVGADLSSRHEPSTSPGKLAAAPGVIADRSPTHEAPVTPKASPETAHTALAHAAEPRSRTGLLVTTAVLAIGALYFLMPSRAIDPCRAAISQSNARLVSGDALGARTHMASNIALCIDDDRLRATEVLAAADRSIAADAACARSVRQVGSLIDDRRVTRARSAYEQLGSACASTPPAKDVLERLDASQLAVTQADAQFRKNLAAGDLTAARMALDQLAARNREYADLPELRKALQLAVTAQEAAVKKTAAAAAQAMSRGPSAATATLATPSSPQPTAPPQNTTSEVAQSFLRDAESALRQLKFDAAKTYVDSARRIDPQNAQAAALARRIRERELQYLSDETSIK